MKVFDSKAQEIYLSYNLNLATPIEKDLQQICILPLV